MILQYGSQRYKKVLKKLGLTVYKRYDPTFARLGRWATYLVAPVVEDGKKIEWQIYHDNPAFKGVKPTMQSFKTKKGAVKYLRNEIKLMDDLDLDDYGIWFR